MTPDPEGGVTMEVLEVRALLAARDVRQREPRGYWRIMGCNYQKTVSVDEWR